MTFVFLLMYQHRSDVWVCGVFETMAGAKGQHIHDRGMDICDVCFHLWSEHHIREEQVRP